MNNSPKNPTSNHPTIQPSAFTLAEVMIVLSIIGILIAILLPVAYNATPNEDILKFKKTYNTLNNTIKELVNSDKYYLDGDLGVKSDGTLIDSPTYFCETIADVLNIKVNNCKKYLNIDTDKTGYWTAVKQDGSTDLYNNTMANQVLESDCIKTFATGLENPIVLSDGVVIWEAFPHTLFGSVDEYNSRVAHMKNDDGFFQMYKAICFDIDGIKVGDIDSTQYSETLTEEELKEIYKKHCVNNCPFAIGVRYDGKLLNGASTDEWLNKSIQEK